MVEFQGQTMIYLILDVALATIACVALAWLLLYEIPEKPFEHVEPPTDPPPTNDFQVFL